MRTFVVLGAFRGGTSAIAGLLRIFGIAMGKNFDDRKNHEDLDFQNVTVEEAQQLIKERNKEFDVWGWKFPGAIDYIDKLNIRNPKYIIIFRDVLAITLSEKKHNNFDITLSKAQEHINKLINFNKQSYLISYEKLLINKEEEIERLADYCDIELTPEIRERALRFIQPKKYNNV